MLFPNCVHCAFSSLIRRQPMLVAFFCCLAVAAAQSPEKTGVVLLGANGPAPYTQALLDDMTDYLSGQQVKVKQADDSGKSRVQLTEVAKSTGAKSLIYFTVSGLGMHEFPKMTAQCFDPDGALLWKEDAGTGASLTFSPAGAAKKLDQNMRKKLAAHVDALKK